MNEETKPGLKYDSGKPKWHLLPLVSVREIVKVLTFGEKKYTANSWQNLKEPQERYFSAAMRHIEAWQSGSKLDEESGLNHLAHAGCCIIFALWFDLFPERIQK